MRTVSLDSTDHDILHELQRDARNRTNAEIAERIGVSASTVGKRITRLEEEDVITGYFPKIDHERVGFPLHVLFVCTAPITERGTLIDRVLDIEAVVGASELMTGRRNAHIRVVGRTNDDVTNAAHAIDELGFSVTDEILVRDDHIRPSRPFG